jgi:hypothetical protein
VAFETSCYPLVCLQATGAFFFVINILVPVPHFIFKQIRSHPCHLVCTVAQGRLFTCLKHLGFFDFPITSSFFFSVPSAVAHRTIMRSLESSLPTHFSPCQVSIQKNNNPSLIRVNYTIVCITFAHTGPHGVNPFCGRITVYIRGKLNEILQRTRY